MSAGAAYYGGRTEVFRISRVLLGSIRPGGRRRGERRLRVVLYAPNNRVLYADTDSMLVASSSRSRRRLRELKRAGGFVMYDIMSPYPKSMLLERDL